MNDAWHVVEYRQVASENHQLGLWDESAVVKYGGEAAVERYYRVQSSLYDLTRWTFLFGRTRLLRCVAALGTPGRILEVGCGTGRNLVELARLFPTARITGLDLSQAMLARARRKTAGLGQRVELVHGRYDKPLHESPSFDLVLFSYSLTMFNPGFEIAIDSARRDLVPGGRVAAVDFHDSPWPWFTTWMQLNHVRTDAQLRPVFRRYFETRHDEVRLAYGGVWRYFMFLGH